MSAVLIVDDNAADRALLRTILGRAGYSVFEAAKGHEAIQQARAVRPHVIILDVNLPDWSGLEVCRAVRADRELSTIPVLMLTVRHDDTDVVAGLEAGADDYVVKDAAGAIILGRVRRLIEFRQMAGLAMLNQQLAQIGRLLTGIVHEIRGPLAVIRGNAELLRLNHPSDAEEAQWIESILRSTRLLQLRLDHLMATVRNRSAEVQVIDVPPLLHEAVDLFVKGLPPGDRQVQVEVVGEPPVPQVRVDPGRLMQVLLNLLSNAQEALARTQRAGRILVRCGTAVSQGQSWVTVDVADDGPGIPEVYIDRIFEPFFTTREEGTGYGLYLAREIVKEQAGHITARNNPEGGATFTIWLPEAS
ncbi:MAG TPA: response regulator [Isosphaeraceae bacterium]|nr:response regulator [Isosphaeraceae bacterium]